MSGMHLWEYVDLQCLSGVKKYSHQFVPKKFFIILNNIQKASISEYIIYTATSYRDEKKLRFNAYFFPKFIIFLYGFHFRKGQEIFYRYCSLNGYLLEVLKSKSTSKAFGSKNYFL